MRVGVCVVRAVHAVRAVRVVRVVHAVRVVRIVRVVRVVCVVRACAHARARVCVCSHVPLTPSAAVAAMEM